MGRRGGSAEIGGGKSDVSLVPIGSGFLTELADRNRSTAAESDPLPLRHAHLHRHEHEMSQRCLVNFERIGEFVGAPGSTTAEVTSVTHRTGTFSTVWGADSVAEVAPAKAGVAANMAARVNACRRKAQSLDFFLRIVPIEDDPRVRAKDSAVASGSTSLTIEYSTSSPFAVLYKSNTDSWSGSTGFSVNGILLAISANSCSSGLRFAPKTT